MDDLDQVLKKGTLLIIETGEYSDYRFGGPVRMLKDITKFELVDAYKREWKPEFKWEAAPGPDGFLPWLISAGWAESVSDVHSWHIGCYVEFLP